LIQNLESDLDKFYDLNLTLLETSDNNILENIKHVFIKNDICLKNIDVDLNILEVENIICFLIWYIF